jgi:pyruvate kinase
MAGGELRSRKGLNAPGVDLGVEIPIERIAIERKRLVRRANLRG